MDNVLDRFDPYAMIQPKTKEDVVALLRECNALMDEFAELWRDMERKVEGWDD